MQSKNHLATETSPYLLQHADNPVEWYPWNEAALARARKENKPILVSIGYAACHWCHVMAHESFIDQETAQLMNELFINIKVDREERPDLDKIYQSAHYLLTQQPGGWPLTVFLTPEDLIPYFSGTYFPKIPKFDLPSFKEVLKTVAEIYRNHPEEINLQNKQLITILNHQIIHETPSELNNEPLKIAMQTLEHHYDEKNGGFGGAPKFPHPMMLEFLLQFESNFTLVTLEKMAMGGIYDQLAGGFFRYTVDAEWRIPHFEKMLYDNAQLIFLYAKAHLSNPHSLFGKIAHETALWILDNMQSPEGGFYSSLDADSEGHEGKYYIWNKFEVRSLLEPEKYSLISTYYGLDKEPNFEKQWHLYITEPLSTLAERMNLSMNEAIFRVETAKKTLLTARQKRTPPSCDKKILTAWNALTIKALLVASDILEEPRFHEAATKALSFIQKHIWKNNRLFATYNENQARFMGYLDDYAFLLDAMITKLQVKWTNQDLTFAEELADALLTHFQDPNGGFYFTANDHEQLIQRPKALMDDAIPAGNGIAAKSLLTLGYLTGNTKYIDSAINTLKSAWQILKEFPAEHSSLLLALKDYLEPPVILTIRGPVKSGEEWFKYSKKLQPLVFLIPDETRDSVSATLCRGTTCFKEAKLLEEFKSMLSGN